MTKKEYVDIVSSNMLNEAKRLRKEADKLEKESRLLLTKTDNVLNLMKRVQDRCNMCPLQKECWKWKCGCQVHLKRLDWSKE